MRAGRRGGGRGSHNTGRYHGGRRLGFHGGLTVAHRPAGSVRLHGILLTAQLTPHLLVKVLFEHVGHGDHILPGLVVEQTVLDHALKVLTRFA